MTGLARKGVRPLRSRVRAAATTGLGTVPADVLRRWHTDPRYLDPPGIPRELPFEGLEPSFAGLVRACAGDLPAGAVRAELLRMGAVAEAPSGALRASRREVVFGSAMDAMLEGFATSMRPVTLTVAWNAAMAASGGHRRFQRAVISRQMPADRFGAAEEVVRQRLTAWAGVEWSPGPVVPTATLGIGMKYFKEPRPGGTDR
jgi:hypothetical protein